MVYVWKSAFFHSFSILPLFLGRVVVVVIVSPCSNGPSVDRRRPRRLANISNVCFVVVLRFVEEFFLSLVVYCPDDDDARVVAYWNLLFLWFFTLVVVVVL